MTKESANSIAIESHRTVRDLAPEISTQPRFKKLLDTEIPDALKAPVGQDELEHRHYEDSEFWREIPAFAKVSRDEFMDHRFQNRRSVNSIAQLGSALGNLVPKTFLDDVQAGIARAPMSLRLSPYILGLIDWSNPYADPLRIQFVPTGSTQLPDHPKLTLDSLHEQADSPTPGLTHRYPDKTLFLPLDVCPVYCRFCTRSYAIGSDTDTVDKAHLRPNTERWNAAIAYLASRPEVEDVVVSGGDAYMLPAAHLRNLGELLLAIPHIRRIRIATKGPAVAPMKILTDEAWTGALLEMAASARQQGKEVFLHTHFNSPAEITRITYDAMLLLFKSGLTVRNQTVLIRGVNDTPEVMAELIKRLGYMNVRPYYVYQHDMVMHVEELRTTVGTNQEIERQVRGCTAGFNIPLFIVDLPGGGGKRDVHSHDYYDTVSGISVYRSPAVDEELVYLYFDPIDLLPEEGQRRWARPGEREAMISEAIDAAGLGHLKRAVA